MIGTAQLLKALRTEALLSQNALAQRAGMRRTDISKLESGALKCTLASTRRRLATGFGIPLELFDDYLEARISLDELVEARITAEAP